jgi:hypothetical protein
MMSEVLRRISPANRLQLLGKIDSAFAEHARVKLSYIDKVYKAAENKLKDMGTLNEADKAQLDAAFASVPAEAKVFYAERRRVIDLTEKAVDLATDKGLFVANDYIEQAMRVDDNADLLTREENRARIASVKETLAKFDQSKFDDPKKFLTMRSDAVAEASKGVMVDLTDIDAPVDQGAWQHYITTVQAAANKYGVPASLVSKEEAKSLSSVIRAASNVGTDEVMGKLLNNLQMKFGDDLPSVLADAKMVGGSDVDDQIPLLGLASDPATPYQVLKNVSNRKKIEEDFAKYTAPGTITTFKDAMIGVQEQLSDKFYAGQAANQDFVGIRAMVSAIDLEAKRLASRQGSPMEADKAVETATKMVMKNFNYLDVDDKTIPVPAKFSVTPIKRWIDLNLPRKTVRMGTKHYDPSLVGDEKTLGKLFPGMNFGKEVVDKNIPDEILPEWHQKNTNLESVPPKTFVKHAKIIPTQDGLGVQFVYIENGKMSAITDKGGNPLFKAYRDLENFSISGYEYYAPTKELKSKKKQQNEEEVQPTPTDIDEDPNAKFVAPEKNLNLISKPEGMSDDEYEYLLKNDPYSLLPVEE